MAYIFLLYDFVPTKSMLAKKCSYSQRLNSRLFRIGRIFFSKAEICDKRVYAIIAYAVSRTKHLFCDVILL